jgi:hypothetical protein
MGLDKKFVKQAIKDARTDFAQIEKKSDPAARLEGYEALREKLKSLYRGPQPWHIDTGMSGDIVSGGIIGFGALPLMVAAVAAPLTVPAVLALGVAGFAAGGGLSVVMNTLREMNFRYLRCVREDVGSVRNGMNISKLSHTLDRRIFAEKMQIRDSFKKNAAVSAEAKASPKASRPQTVPPHLR